jgi:protoporphyrinogen/coproporphyrinogen III oxidase
MTEHFDTIIIGGGLSGLTAAHKLRTHCPGHRFLMLEKSASTGGAIRTHRENGYISEIGPHGFLDNCLESRQLLLETGLDKECVKAPLLNFVRYVCLNGQLCCIPQTPKKILMAPLIPWKNKLRVLADLWTKPIQGEPTVAKWVAHRFGPALLPFADAVFTGTYAGDFNELTIDSVMPGVRALEKEHGSVLRGMIARIWQAKRSGKAAKKLTMPAMTSFPGGMCRLTERLTEDFTPETDLLLNCGALSVVRCESGWQVASERGVFSATNLILALPVNAALRLLQDITPASPMNEIPEAWLATVVFGFAGGASIPPGFGYLTPEQEGRFTLGTLFSSNMFPGRAPEGHVVFETLVGGRRHPERLELDDATMTRLALQDVREILNLTAEPEYSTVLRPVGGIPQLERGYPRLLAWRDRLLQENPGLYVCGFGWEGIGINDMIKTADRTVASLRNASGTGGYGTEIKKVYF